MENRYFISLVTRQGLQAFFEIPLENLNIDGETRLLTLVTLREPIKTYSKNGKRITEQTLIFLELE